MTAHKPTSAPSLVHNARSLAELLCLRAAELPDKTLYSFSSADKTNEITYSELQHQATTLAQRLQETCETADRALLMFPPGLEFIQAFFGCQAAGVVPVPVYPVSGGNASRVLPRLQAIVQAAEPAVLLTTQAMRQSLAPLLSQLPGTQALHVLAIDEKTSEASTLSDSFARQISSNTGD